MCASELNHRQMQFPRDRSPTSSYSQLTLERCRRGRGMPLRTHTCPRRSPAPDSFSEECLQRPISSLAAGWNSAIGLLLSIRIYILYIILFIKYFVSKRIRVLNFKSYWKQNKLFREIKKFFSTRCLKINRANSA